MSDINPYFMDPCELVTIVYGSDGITEMGRYSFRGYMEGMNLFFQICSLLSYEVAHSHRFKDTDFENFASILRSSFYWEVSKGKAKTLEGVLRRYIDDLRKYKFIAQKIFPTLPESSATYEHHRRFEITIDYIFREIQEMRRQRIIFYEYVLQEYKMRKDIYNRHLREYLKDNKRKIFINSPDLDIDSILSELGIDSENQSSRGLYDSYYEIHSQSWYLKDVIDLENPEIERYTKKLPRYRTGEIHTHPEGVKAFFELFFIFRDEMSFILPDEPNKSFFERVLMVLKRDFLDGFEQHGDLEDVIVKHIEELEKYEFLSLPKEQFFNKLSKMIYRLRTRRIAFYEAVLADYLANKEKYDNAM